MRYRRKHNSCQNCNYPLDSIYNYCPNCGQENTDSNLPFHKLLGEFVTNYFALDSRFIKTIRPFFLKPGYLTNKFMAGRRVTYTHPIRIYLIVSLIFFAMFSFSVSGIIDTSEENTIIEVEAEEISDIEGLPDSTRHKINFTLSDNTILALEKSISNTVESAKLEELRRSLHQLQENEKAQLVAIFSQEETDFLTHKTADSTFSPLNRVAPGKKPELGFMSPRFFTVLDTLIDNRSYSNEEIVEILSTPNLSTPEYYATKQIIRLRRSDNESIVSYIIKNLSIMMLLLIPLFALLLKLIYIRRKIYYLKHLIHGLHIHSFAYLIYGVCILLAAFVFDEVIGPIAFLTGATVVAVYMYLSFLRVYNQHWFKTFIKFMITATGYIFFILIFFVAEILISFLLF